MKNKSQLYYIQKMVNVVPALSAQCKIAHSLICDIWTFLSFDSIFAITSMMTVTISNYDVVR